VIPTLSQPRGTDPPRNGSGICVSHHKRLGQNREITAKPLTNARKVARQQNSSRSFPFDAHAIPCYPMASRNGGPTAHAGTQVMVAPAGGPGPSRNVGELCPTQARRIARKADRPGCRSSSAHT
jgi:hypothetical protein